VPLHFLDVGQTRLLFSNRQRNTGVAAAERASLARTVGRPWKTPHIAGIRIGVLMTSGPGRSRFLVTFHTIFSEDAVESDDDPRQLIEKIPSSPQTGIRFCLERSDALWSGTAAGLTRWHVDLKTLTGKLDAVRVGCGNLRIASKASPTRPASVRRNRISPSSKRTEIG